MTKPQRDMLELIAGGVDPGDLVAAARLVGKRKANSVARLLLALYGQRYLQQRAFVGGLEISDAGREAAARAGRRSR